MTHEELEAVFLHLKEIEWLYLPYDLMPGSTGRDLTLPLTAAEWNRYEWNPPQYLKHLPEYSKPDPVASPKPVWSVLDRHITPAMLAKYRPLAIIHLKDQCEAKIQAAYGQTNKDDEIYLRLRNVQTTSQDTERDRLLARYKKHKTWIMERATVDQLKAFIDNPDVGWEPTPSPTPTPGSPS